MVSVSDSAPEVPGFADHLGERFIVPQPSGSLLEFLYVRPDLAAAPFFEAAVKDRVARLANFRHSSYTRVRRFQRSEDRGGAALVSTHVPGRRLAEVLQISARAGMKPPAVATLALARQLMTAAALMHDYGPDIFHGTLGPERLILPGEGRVVVCEYVLGGVFEQAVPAWGVAQAWRDWRVPMLADTGLARYGRRVDLLQVGLVVLAFMLGRPLSAADYPEGLAPLVEEACEPAAGEQAVPEGVRGWLSSLLFPDQPSALRTLVEAQKAFGTMSGAAGQAGEAPPSMLQAFLDRCEANAFPQSSSGRSPAPTPSTLISAAAMLEAAPASQAQPPGVAEFLSSGEIAPRFDSPEIPQPEPSADWFTPSGEYFGFDNGSCEAVPALTLAPEPAPLLPELSEPPEGPEPPTLAELAVEADVALPVEAAPVEGDADAAALPVEPPAPTPSPSEAFPTAADGSAADATPSPTPTRLGWSEPAGAQGPAPAKETRRATVESTGRPKPASGSHQGIGAVRPAGPQRKVPWRKIVFAACALLVVAAAAIVAPIAWTRVTGGTPLAGRLAVESMPPGAEVLLDGKAVGRTPATVKASAGQHHVEVRVGGSSRSAWVTVPQDSILVHKVSIPEAALRGGLNIVTNPPGGLVAVDGNDRGKSPAQVNDLATGPHKVVATGPFGPVEEEVSVVGGAVTTVTVATAGWVRARAPYPLQVSDKGQVYGETSGQALMVPAGRHHFDLVNTALALKVRQFVDVQPGSVVTIPFEPPMGMMNLSSDEPAEVWLDGSPIGRTPLTTLPVPLGSHQVVFRHERLGEVSYSVNVTLAAPVRLTVTFMKKRHP